MLLVCPWLHDCNFRASALNSESSPALKACKGGSDRMRFEDMVVYLADGVPEQKTRDAVKHAGSRLTSDLHMPQSVRSRPLALESLTFPLKSIFIDPQATCKCHGGRRCNGRLPHRSISGGLRRRVAHPQWSLICNTVQRKFRQVNHGTCLLRYQGWPRCLSCLQAPRLPFAISPRP